jgi:DeoR/GlpR family transcriptional regulator of sugar metabolism
MRGTYPYLASSDKSCHDAGDTLGSGREEANGVQRHERWTTLLEMLTTGGRIEIDDAAARLSVSTATIRRDLDELALQDVLVRTRGGAMPHSVAYELPLRYKAAQRADEKQAIARAVGHLVPPGAVVAMNGGTTSTEVARTLATRTDGAERSNSNHDPTITIVTNALNIAHEMAVRPQVKLVLTGGVCRPQSYELIGPLAMPVLEQITLDVAILGVNAISVDAGACANHEGEAAINQLMAKRAHQVIVIADSTKLGRHAFARICSIDEIDIIVTDEEADTRQVADLEDAGVRVVLAAR